MKLVQAGMNVCRLNFSHGTHEDHAMLMKTIREIRKKTGEPLTFLQDLQGPKIRVGDLPKEGVQLKAGSLITFTTGTPSIPKKLPVTYPALHEDVRPGQHILMDDGLLSVQVERVEGKDVICKVIDGGTLTSHKGMNLPETKTSISAISEKDAEDVRFGVAEGVDWIALSFVRSASDIHELRALIAEAEREQGVASTPSIRVMAKIEKPEAVAHLQEIVDAADGIMVARGDLGIEIPAEQVPLVQKRLIQMCVRAGKPVIVATQMLDSMIRNPRATRAEVSDIANAAIDHTDATMLSGETASGNYPLEAVTTMAKVLLAVEGSPLDDLPRRKDGVLIEGNTRAKAVIVATQSGDAARLVSRERPEMPIIAVTSSTRVQAQLNVSWGVRPVVKEGESNIAALIDTGIALAKKEGAVQAGDEVVVVAGEPRGSMGHVELVETRRVV